MPTATGDTPPVPPVPSGPSALPVEACIDELRSALAGPGRAVLQAPPGAGKTTIVPLRLLDEPWLAGRRIVMLEPRRLATRAAAQRMAELVGEPVGATVGYRTRDDRHVSDATRIEVITEGILTRRLQSDPSLDGTGLVVFDEIHERNLQSDLALALTLDARSVLRPDLRVLAMSATLDTDQVAAALGPSTPVITSTGRSFPVEMRWRPHQAHPRPSQRPGGDETRRQAEAEAVATAVLDALRTDPGDMLVFLAGAADITRVASILTRRVPPDVDVRPLFGALAPAEQDLALSPSPTGRRRVVLSTDIAETSLTVDGVRIVVDSGRVRSPFVDGRSGLTRLHTGANSKASADQRAGRSGRLGPGVAYRLWSPTEHERRAPFAAPEITTVDLAGFALEVAAWGTPVDQLRLIDPPPPVALAEAEALLRQLQALDAEGRVTATGRAMLALPVHPRLARMIVASTTDADRRLGAAMAALLDDRDVLRGRPDDRPSDIADRVGLVVGTTADGDRGVRDGRGRDDHDRGNNVDRGALDTVRRRYRQLSARAQLTRNGPVDLSRCGAVLALAYPERVAQARGNGRFRLRNGAGATLGPADPLRTEAFLAVADIDIAGGHADGRIRLAAALDEHDLLDAAGREVTDTVDVFWSAERNDVVQRRERRLGALVLSSTEGRPDAGPDTTAVLVDHVRATRLEALRWTDAARDLQARVGFARRVVGPSWPDVSDAELLTTLDIWLTPRLDASGARRRGDVERIDLTRVIRDVVGPHRVHHLDALVPKTVTLASGRSVRVDYTADTPTIASRVQDFYGTTVHPTVADGRHPLTVSLLSPAGRPVQVTADLPGFWTGSWAAVRKDLAGRYPKHRWPVDPGAN
jgi:ATP-dependent helicase HrpB